VYSPQKEKYVNTRKNVVSEGEHLRIKKLVVMVENMPLKVIPMRDRTLQC
jgi:hypothetical protein